MSANKSQQAKAFAAFFAPKRKAAPNNNETATTTGGAAAAADPAATSPSPDAAAAAAEPAAKQARTEAHTDAHTVITNTASSDTPAAAGIGVTSSADSGSVSPAVSAAVSPAVTPTKKKATATQRRRLQRKNYDEEEGVEVSAAPDVVMDSVSPAPNESATAASPSPSPAASPAASPAPTAAAPSAAASSTPKASASASKVAPSKQSGSKKKGAAAGKANSRAAAAEEEEEEETGRQSNRAAAAAAADAEDADDSDVEESLLGAEDAMESSEAGGSSKGGSGGGAYDPVKSASWTLGQPVPYSALAQLMERIEGEGSRLLTIGWLSDFLRSVIALSPDQLLHVVYLCCNQIAPAYEGKETMVGDFILLKAIAETTGGTVAKLKLKLAELGDLGEVAMSSRGAQKTMFRAAKLTCTKVYQSFRAMADIAGKDSGQKKADMIKKMIVACEGNEARYIIRALQGNLRIGMAEKSVVTALARAVTLTPPSLDGSLPPPVLDVRRVLRDQTKLSEALERTLHLINQAYTEVPNHELVIDCILRFGVDQLPSKCFLKPGVPVKVMLGKPTTGVDALLEKFKDMIFTLEYKYDGERAQVHLLRDGRIMIYSRNSEDHTPKYPDVAINLPRAFNTAVGQTAEDFPPLAVTVLEQDKNKETEGSDATATPDAAAAAAAAAAFASSASPAVSVSTAAAPSPNALVPASAVVGPAPTSLSSPLITDFIIDCEVVAWDRVKKKILPFQTLSTRKKKDVNQDDITVQVCLFAFDLLFINGVSYINESLKKRREVLRQHFHPVDGQFYFATYKDTSEPEEISSFMEEAVRDSCEGLMIKSLEVDASYVPNKRNWVKMKKDYMDGVADSLDLVVIGGWRGLGKRTGVYGAYLLATYDPDTEMYQSICKVGTGFSDQMLEESAQYFSAHELAKAPRDYQYPKESKKDIPEVWFEATRIWEVRCADLSISPVHMAAIGKVHESKGIALRFPRYIRLRDDKSVPDGITNADQVVEFFQAQSVQGGGAGGAPKRGGR